MTYLPPLHLLRMDASEGKYFGVCIARGCKWRAKKRALLADAEQDARLHCQTANLAEQAKVQNKDGS